MAVVNESDADMVLADGETVEVTLSSSTEAALTEAGSVHGSMSSESIIEVVSVVGRRGPARKHVRRVPSARRTPRKAMMAVSTWRLTVAFVTSIVFDPKSIPKTRVAGGGVEDGSHHSNTCGSKSRGENARGAKTSSGVEVGGRRSGK